MTPDIVAPVRADRIVPETNQTSEKADPACHEGPSCP
jgi:hypothetical protein